MELNILVADDDAVFRELICDILVQQHYSVIEAENGQQAVDLFFAASSQIHLVILDVMMPHLDGWEALEIIRSDSDVPVLMLTALGDETYEIKGLRLGADDYISKPFSYEVFIARVGTLLRKTKRDRKADLSVGKLFIHQLAHRVLVDSEEVTLNRKEYLLLLYLIQNRGLLLDRERILSRVWGYDFDGDIRTIDTHIKTLRAKLGKCGQYIQTVRGSGYRFEVTE